MGPALPGPTLSWQQEDGGPDGEISLKDLGRSHMVSTQLCFIPIQEHTRGGGPKCLRGRGREDFPRERLTVHCPGPPLEVLFRRLVRGLPFTRNVEGVTLGSVFSPNSRTCQYSTENSLESQATHTLLLSGMVLVWEGVLIMLAPQGGWGCTCAPIGHGC